MANAETSSAAQSPDVLQEAVRDPELPQEAMLEERMETAPSASAQSCGELENAMDVIGESEQILEERSFPAAKPTVSAPNNGVQETTGMVLIEASSAAQPPDGLQEVVREPERSQGAMSKEQTESAPATSAHVCEELEVAMEDVQISKQMTREGSFQPIDTATQILVDRFSSEAKPTVPTSNNGVQETSEMAEIQASSAAQPPDSLQEAVQEPERPQGAMLEGQMESASSISAHVCEELEVALGDEEISKQTTRKGAFPPIDSATQILEDYLSPEAETTQSTPKNGVQQSRELVEASSIVQLPDGLQEAVRETKRSHDAMLEEQMETAPSTPAQGFGELEDAIDNMEVSDQILENCSSLAAQPTEPTLNYGEQETTEMANADASSAAQPPDGLQYAVRETNQSQDAMLKGRMETAPSTSAQSFAIEDGEISEKMALEGAFPSIDAAKQMLEVRPSPAPKPTQSTPIDSSPNKCASSSTSRSQNCDRLPTISTSDLSSSALPSTSSPASKTLPLKIASSKSCSGIPTDSTKYKVVGKELLKAAHEGRLQDVQRLLVEGADIHYQNSSKRTPLHFAADGGSVDVISVLIAAGADVNSEDKDKETVLHLAAKNGKEEAVRALLAAGASVDRADSGGNTVMHYIVRNGNAATVQALIAAGASANSENIWKSVPLHWAAVVGNEATLQALVTAGADANSQNNEGSSPLHWAARRGKDTAVQALITAGANVGSRDIEGNTPLHFAARYNQPGVVRALIAAGATKNNLNNEGQTPLNCAERYDSHAAQRELSDSYVLINILHEPRLTLSNHAHLTRQPYTGGRARPRGRFMRRYIF